MRPADLDVLQLLGDKTIVSDRGRTLRRSFTVKTVNLTLVERSRLTVLINEGYLDKLVDYKQIGDRKLPAVYRVTKKGLLKLITVGWVPKGPAPENG